MNESDINDESGAGVGSGAGTHVQSQTVSPSPETLLVSKGCSVMLGI